jgi:hypothetical protein
MKRHFFIVFFIVFEIGLYANQPLVRNFTRKEYKSGAQNWGIAQDENNIMYFANNNGLLVFDGKNWLTVPINNGTNVRSVSYAGKGKFYASTFNEFGYFEKMKNGKFEYFSLTKKKGLTPIYPMSYIAYIKPMMWFIFRERILFINTMEKK